MLHPCHHLPVYRFTGLLQDKEGPVVAEGNGLAASGDFVQLQLVGLIDFGYPHPVGLAVNAEGEEVVFPHVHYVGAELVHRVKVGN